MTRKRFLFCLASSLWLSPWLNAQGPTRKYDLFFGRWAAYYAPWEDWRYFRAQGISESYLKPEAVGAAGELGIMQLMPATVTSLHVANPRDPEASIQAGIHLDATLWHAWSDVKSLGDRRRLMFASYNAGYGNIQRAVRLAQSLAWDDVAVALPRVTGKRYAAATINYVRGIHHIMGVD